MFKGVIILLFLCQTHCSQASSFLPLLSSNGSSLCAAGNSSYAIQTNDIIGIPCGVPGATKCAFYCTGLNSRITCTGFNYLTSGLCQFFSDPCVNSDSITGCVYYQDTRLIQTSSCKRSSSQSPACNSTNKLFVTADNVVLNVYINGNQTSFDATYASVWTQVKYVPLLCEVVSIAIQAQNQGGTAGLLVWDFSGVIMSNATWKCKSSPDIGWMSASFDDSTWKSATEEASYGSGIWASSVNNAPTSAAKWIWTPGATLAGDASTSVDAYCRIKLK